MNYMRMRYERQNENQDFKCTATWSSKLFSIVGCETLTLAETIREFDL